LIAQYPDRPEFNSALAMAFLREGLPSKVLDLMPMIRSTRKVAPMMADAIEGAALVLADRPEPGSALLKTIEWNGFMRQERLVFREILLRKKIADLPLPELDVADTKDNPGAISEWRKVIGKLEKARANDVLPPLPRWEPPKMPDLPDTKPTSTAPR
jgi:hypothetical protein